MFNPAEEDDYDMEGGGNASIPPPTLPPPLAMHAKKKRGRSSLSKSDAGEEGEDEEEGGALKTAGGSSKGGGSQQGGDLAAADAMRVLIRRMHTRGHVEKEKESAAPTRGCRRLQRIPGIMLDIEEDNAVRFVIACNIHGSLDFLH